MPETSAHAAGSSRSRRWILLTLVVATVLKILWAANSSGSIDCVLFYNFATAIEKHGLIGVYRLNSLFNHTPLTGELVYGLYQTASAASADMQENAGAAQKQSGNPAFFEFSFLLRFVTILADVVAVIAIASNRERLGSPPTWALVLFAASPISLMISGLHGNVDPIMIMFLVLATVATMRGNEVWSGVALGLSCIVKVAVLPFVPVFFFYWLARNRGWKFVIACGAVGLAGTAWPLIACPQEFVRNVLGYGSYWGTWGIPYWLRASGWEAAQGVDFRNLSPAQMQIMQALKIIIIGGILLIGWQRRKAEGAAFVITLAACWVWFFIFAPGVGMQYFVWISPFLLLAWPHAYLVFLITATNFLYAFYDLASNGQWKLAIPLDEHLNQWSAQGKWCWLTLVGILVWKARQFFSLEGNSSTGEPTTQPG